MIGPNRGLAALALLLTISISLKGEKSTTQPFPSQLTTIQGRDLPGDYAEVEIVDFAFSPDNAKITVGFEVREGEKDLGAWLAEWELGTRKLIAKMRVASHVSPGLRSIALNHDTIRYTADGSEVICQIGRGLYVLDASTLTLRYSLSIPDLAGGSASEVEDRTFAISADARRLVLFFGQSLYPYKIGFIGLYEIRTGEELAHWSLSAQIQSLSLSPDGKQLLATVLNPKDTTDILLLDSTTGRLIKSFESGFGTHQGAQLNAVFIDADHFVVVPDASIDAKGGYLGNELKIFDFHTGKVTGELTYEKQVPPETSGFLPRRPH
ncbi:MAG: hypothetical protein LAN63_19455 [Acidobacteriia bacterium]|nr:hypothetical protein [Terriglobia bacterium]